MTNAEFGMRKEGHDLRSASPRLCFRIPHSPFRI